MSSPPDFETRVSNAQRLIDERAEKKPRELSNEVAGNIEFPGRDAWEKRLYDQKGKVIGAAQAVLDAAQKILKAPTRAEQASARTATVKLLSDLDWQRNNYDQLVAEGVKKAGDWERKPR
jgi:hypothetical protein